MGVYLDNDTFAHASSSQGVTKSSIKEKYYIKRFVKAEPGIQYEKKRIAFLCRPDTFWLFRK